MPKGHKSQARKPDDVLTYGPLRISRYGRQIIWESHWPEGTFREAQKLQVEEYPRIVGEIDALVLEIAALVRGLPPKALLHRAWWEMAGRHTKISSEAEIGSDDAVSMRMIDYVQSVIASVEPEAIRPEEVSEADWSALRRKVDRLFQILNVNYQICRTAKKRAEDPELNMEIEEFHFRAQVYWCNVRGSRYQVHEPAYLRDMFLPHSGILQELFGLSGEQFVEEILKVWRALSFGIGEVTSAFIDFQNDVETAVERKIAVGLPDLPDMAALISEVVKENGWESRQNYVLGRFLGMDLFDLQKTTSIPESLLKELSWSPGEEKEFFTEGEFCGWPLRVWPIFKRPFIKLEDRYFCFDLYSLIDHLYRTMRRIIVRLKPDYAERWKLLQQDASETLPFTYLHRLLPGAQVVRSVYYRGRTDTGGLGWCETDGLLFYDDHLFIVEARGGAFTHTPPSTDFPAYINSLTNLVLKPANQGKRFLEYLETAGTVPLFDKDHNQIGEIKKNDFDS